jgi:hypothetical protein
MPQDKLFASPSLAQIISCFSLALEIVKPRKVQSKTRLIYDVHTFRWSYTSIITWALLVSYYLKDIDCFPSLRAFMDYIGYLVDGMPLEASYSCSNGRTAKNIESFSCLCCSLSWKMLIRLFTKLSFFISLHYLLLVMFWQLLVFDMAHPNSLVLVCCI